MKKKMLPAVMFVITLIAFTMSGCNEGPWDYPDSVEWYSEDPIVEVSKQGQWLGTITIDSKVIDVRFGWGPGHFSVYKCEGFVDVWEDSLLLIKGGLRMHENNVVLTIRVDNIYNHKYETITLKQRPEARGI